MANINAFRPALPDLRDIVSTDDFFGTAKRKFPLYLSDGYYRQQDEPCIFIQRITKGGHSHPASLPAHMFRIISMVTSKNTSIPLLPKNFRCPICSRSETV